MCKSYLDVQVKGFFLDLVWFWTWFGSGQNYKKLIIELVGHINQNRKKNIKVSTLSIIR